MATSFDSDDVDLLSIMSKLEKAAGVAAGPDALGAKKPSATAALAALGDVGQQREKKTTVTTKPRISSSAATVLHQALERHPALNVHQSRYDLTQVWLDAVRASLAYHDAHDDDDDDSDSGPGALDRSLTSIPSPGKGQVPLVEEHDHGPRSLSTAPGQTGSRAPIQDSLLEQFPLHSPGTMGIKSSFLFAQRAADVLECERLHALVHGARPAEVLRANEALLSERFGVDIQKADAFPGDAAAIPQRIYLHSLFGPLMTTDVALWASPAGSVSSSTEPPRLAEVSITVSSTAVARAVERVSRDPYDTAAWLIILPDALELPLAEVRPALQLATYLFPTCAPLVEAYAKKELEEFYLLLPPPPLDSSAAFSPSSSCRSFAEGDDEMTARRVFFAKLRILNIFSRHLTRCLSWKLYDVFLTFVQQYITRDDRIVDRVFRHALEQDAGMSVDSTPLWVRYLEWRSPRIKSVPERLKFCRHLYHRILQTPLDGLAEVRERYDFFESTELGRGGRVRLEDALERSMTRAKSFAADRVALWSRVLHQEFARQINENPLKEQPPGTNPVYLPRPFRPCAQDTIAFSAVKPLVPKREVMQAMNRLYAAATAAASGATRAVTTPLYNPSASAASRVPSSAPVAAMTTTATTTPAVSAAPRALPFEEHNGQCRLEEDEALEEQTMLCMWQRVVQLEVETNLSPAHTEEGHFRRVLYALRMRAQYFPHECCFWLDIADAQSNGLPRKAARNDFGSSGEVGSANPQYLSRDRGRAVVSTLEDVQSVLLPFHVHVTVVLADALRCRLGSPGAAQLLFREGLAQRRHTVLRLCQQCDHLATVAHSRMNGREDLLLVREQHHKRFDAIRAKCVEALREMALLAGNWLTLARVAMPKDSALNVHLTAQYIIREGELLGSVLTCLRRLVKGSQTMRCTHLLDSSEVLSPFNDFCSHWVHLELHQLHSPKAALLVLHGWARQLCVMLQSTRAQQWTAEDCGVDERFFQRAAEVGATLSATSGAADGSHLSLKRDILTLVSTVVEALPPTSTAQRRWAARTAATLDPTGQIVPTEFPQLALYSATTVDSVLVDPALVPAVQQGDTLGAVWASGRETDFASASDAFLWGIAPLPMFGHSLASSAASHERGEGATLGAEMQLYVLVDTASHSRYNGTHAALASSGNVDDDEDDVVHPDIASWTVYAPPPPNRAPRRTMTQRPFIPHTNSSYHSQRRHTTAPRSRTNVRSAASEGNDDASEEEGDVGAPADEEDDEMLQDGDFVGDFDVDDEGNDEASSTMLQVGGAMMTRAAAQQKRTALTLGRRGVVHAASNATAAEGLAFSLDWAAMCRELRALRRPNEEGKEVVPSGEVARRTHRCFSAKRPRTMRALPEVDRQEGMRSRGSRPRGRPQYTALENLLGVVLPSRQSVGHLFIEKAVNPRWLAEVVSALDTNWLQPQSATIAPAAPTIDAAEEEVPL